MPFRDYPQFGTESLKAMTDAYDAVVARLKLRPDDPRRGKLALMHCAGTLATIWR